MAARVGVDLGGTKIEALLLDGDGRERVRRRVDTPRGDYSATLQAIADLVRSVEAEASVPVDSSSVGIGMPGAISPATGLVKNANATWLLGQAFDRDMAAVLGREVRCANDANCLAVSEATDGAAAGAAVVFAVIIGTGTGAGIAINGRVHTGAHAIAGEWGHNPLPWPQPDELPGPQCYCGKTGCLETWLSGPGLAADHRRVTGKALEGREIVAAAEAGDGDAGATLARYVDRLARGLAHVVNILDPDVIVLGGGLSRIGMLYRALPETLPHYVFSDSFETPIRPAQHGDSSGVRGAAWLW